MPSYPPEAVQYDTRLRQLEVVALGASRRAWDRRVRAEDLQGSWREASQELTTVMTEVQREAATAGSVYVAGSLASQGLYEAPSGFVDPNAFAGVAADGRSLEELLYSPMPRTLQFIGAGYPTLQALKMGRSSLDRIARTAVADAGRGAASVDIVSRSGVGYVRMLTPPSCSRCAILAGRFYRWNTGFQRHPRCDCRHVPSSENKAGDLSTDPYEYFKSLSTEDQVKLFGRGEAQAINDGADIFQVVNARRGMKPGGRMTTEGVTRRGNFGSSAAARQTSGRRLTPEAIYDLNGSNRLAALRDLERYGYILPGGQNPLGSIVGQRQGYGQLGAGGSYPAARKRVEDAIKNGRDPAMRATMTAAERRLFDAKARWELVQQGVNPYNAPSMTRRAAVTGKPLTPRIAAQVEDDYRRWISTNGEIFGP